MPLRRGPRNGGVTRERQMKGSRERERERERQEERERDRGLVSSHAESLLQLFGWVRGASFFKIKKKTLPHCLCFIPPPSLPPALSLSLLSLRPVGSRWQAYWGSSKTAQWVTHLAHLKTHTFTVSRSLLSQTHTHARDVLTHWAFDCRPH